MGVSGDQATLDESWLKQALSQAELAAENGEVPVGAVIVKDNQCIASAYNQPIKQSDPSAHAEILALREAGQRLNNYRLVDCVMYVSLEPCAMCAMAMVHARIKRLVFSASDPRTGAVHSVFQLLDDPRLNHQVAWSQGLLANESSDLLKQFFKSRR